MACGSGRSAGVGEGWDDSSGGLSREDACVCAGETEFVRWRFVGRGFESDIVDISYVTSVSRVQ